MAMRNRRISDISLENQIERLKQSPQWFPFVALLSFFSITLLTAHVSFGTNPRIGHPAKLLPFGDTPAEPSAIWFSVTPTPKEIIVTTNDRQVFYWPIDVRGVEQIEDFISYLKVRAREEIMTAAIANEAFLSQTRVMIAADEHLRYRHIRPILYALAKANITNYAFETRMPPTVAMTEGSDDTTN